ncbi:cupin domain-containing protein [Sphingomonas sp. CL5.1]|uniref:hypothetical protein n=1 Tax=Sphingomonas sp. CL5.1 TaxID=2653203 RepID=UPI0015839C91|nr:hypothetical protein [Sphingomonas sp. CL5.1]QKR99893.1 cupin domain-containing protein [Sphingomonas sp. CL5.1]
MYVVDPRDIDPTVNRSSADHRAGRQVHRRILTAMRGGPASLDLGYNHSAAGMDHARPYAYDRDEFCYTVAGNARMVNGGEAVDFGGGMFMWRPAGAVTERFTVTSAYNSICGFGPARVDAWSHLLTPEQIAAQQALPVCPIPQFRNVDEVQPLAGTDDGVTLRVMFDTPAMTMSHIVLDAGARACFQQAARDRVYFVESGSLRATSAAETCAVTAHQFLVVTDRSHSDVLDARERCTIICWSAAIR